MPRHVPTTRANNRRSRMRSGALDGGVSGYPEDSPDRSGGVLWAWRALPHDEGGSCRRAATPKGGRPLLGLMVGLGVAWAVAVVLTTGRAACDLPSRLRRHAAPGDALGPGRRGFGCSLRRGLAAHAWPVTLPLSAGSVSNPHVSGRTQIGGSVAGGAGEPSRLSGAVRCVGTACWPGCSGCSAPRTFASASRWSPSIGFGWGFVACSRCSLCVRWGTPGAGLVCCRTGPSSSFATPTWCDESLLWSRIASA